MFFALASPVFHAIFYGKDRVKGKDVPIKGLTCEGFTWLQKYAGYVLVRCARLEPVTAWISRYLYTDSFATVNTGNVFDVLVTSKKYQVSRLTRYCYEFFQHNLHPGNAAAWWQRQHDTVPASPMLDISLRPIPPVRGQHLRGAIARAESTTR
ncbi:hypothetical protein RvY_11978 [Ramazzottius varieornatus]|uniref:BTB domain-containing protein n=1 Tax=Ramazzottius varieornatus TaxID=947166 RepID=A0A1D1VHV4_RAMVA|nr:hypothetical protein RvY_11978 [Ramazzottius varieornatus]